MDVSQTPEEEAKWQILMRLERMAKDNPRIREQPEYKRLREFFYGP